MLITNKITMALDRREVTPVIDAVQGDSNTRAVEITLTYYQQPWAIPEGVIGVVRFRKSDKTGGAYDTLPDGSAAVTAKDNVLTATLAPQMLTAAGDVDAQVELISGSEHLATFAFRIAVQADPSVGALKSDDYVNLSTFITEEVQKALQTEGAKISAPLYVAIRRNDDGTYTADKSYREIQQAYFTYRTIYAVIGWMLDRPLARLVVTPTGGGTCEFHVHLPENFYRIIIRSDDVTLVEISSGGGGGGEDGGYYAPSMQKMDDDSVIMTFTPSKAGMPAIDPQKIDLPAGPPGESGVTAPVSGFFTLSVDSDGNLWAITEDDAALEFEYDSATGELFIVQEV